MSWYNKAGSVAEEALSAIRVIASFGGEKSAEPWRMVFGISFSKTVGVRSCLFIKHHFTIASGSEFVQSRCSFELVNTQYSEAAYNIVKPHF